MKSNKALRFIVLLIAVMAFFMVYASTGDSSGTSKEKTGVDTSFKGTYVYTFQGNNKDIFEFYENGNMKVYEKMGDNPKEWQEDGKYTLSADGKKIICDGEVHGISYFMLSDDKSYMTASNGWLLYKE
ncbi:MAG: hypothetical protein IKZ57_06385 [Spirochaetia bacterium]|nr:hypothetical protein [Spirochaetia bacterium]